MSNAPAVNDRRRDRWQSIGMIVAAHVVMLSDVGLIDEDAKTTLLTAIDSVSGGDHPVATVAETIVQFDDRVDAQTPAGVKGVARVGRGVADTAATAIRLALRDDLLRVGFALERLRRAALDLASAHMTTLMPAYVGGQPAQPTTLGHFLGGLIGPLGRCSAKLPAVFADVNRSPLGAGALASSGMGIDRERAAELLGFDGLVVNTFDAVSAVDHIVACGEFVTSVAVAIRRLLTELATWLRTEPGSFRLAESWTTALSDLPQLRIPARLNSLVAAAHDVETHGDSLRRVTADMGYGPIAWTADVLTELSENALAGCSAVLDEFAELLTAGLDVNRAYLANRAGRAHTTSSDLADFLMIEEQLDPDAARGIAAITIARIIDQGIEVSGITPEMIDGAALLVIGRELKVEFEAISRYLAPRRFVERHAATGGPSPVTTRAYLDQERIRLAADERWREATSERLRAAAATLRTSIDEALARETSG